MMHIAQVNVAHSVPRIFATVVPKTVVPKAMTYLAANSYIRFTSKGAAVAWEQRAAAMCSTRGGPGIGLKPIP